MQVLRDSCVNSWEINDKSIMRTCKIFEQASYIMPVIILQTHTGFLQYFSKTHTRFLQDSYKIPPRLIQESCKIHTGDVLTVFFLRDDFFYKN